MSTDLNIDRKIIIEEKRCEVRSAYEKFGFNSAEYNKSFEELHDLNMVYMADNFRAVHGLSEKAKTPYC